MSDLSLAYQLSETVPQDDVAAEERGWVQSAREGDLEAFDAIMLRYEARLTRFLMGMVHDPDTAADLCQDTFLSAYQALPRTGSDLRLSAWLHAIALNAARSYHRHRQLRPMVSLRDECVASEDADMQESTANRDAVRRALARLPENYSQPLLLQMASGLTCRDIGSILGCSEAAVKVRLLRARRAFRRLYDEEESD